MCAQCADIWLSILFQFLAWMKMAKPNDHRLNDIWIDRMCVKWWWWWWSLVGWVLMYYIRNAYKTFFDNDPLSICWQHLWAVWAASVFLNQTFFLLLFFLLNQNKSVEFDFEFINSEIFGSGWQWWCRTVLIVSIK